MKLFIFPTTKCDMECTGCFLKKENRTERILMKEDLLRVLKDEALPIGSHIIWAGGEVSVMNEKDFMDLLFLVKKERPDLKCLISLNLMSFPKWLEECVKKYFNNELETSFCLSNRSRFGQSEEEWQKEFFERLKYVLDKGIKVSVFVEAEEKMMRGGLDNLLEKIAILSQYKNQVSWGLGPSINTNKVLNSKGESWPGMNGLPLRISLEDWERLAKKTALLLGNEDMADIWISPISDIMMNSSSASEDESFQGDCVSLFPDGSIRSHPLMADMENYFHIEKNEKKPISKYVKSDFKKRWDDFLFKRIEACKKCDFFDSCDKGLVLTMSVNETGNCLGCKSLRTLLQ